MQAPLPPPQAPPAPPAPPLTSNLTPQASQPAYGSAVAAPNTYGSPISGPVPVNSNQNTLNNMVQEYSIGNNGSPVSAPNTYGSPVSAPETSGFLSAPDNYGSPVNNNQNVLNNVVQEFSIGNKKNVKNTVTGNETIPQQHSISRSNSVLEPEDIKSLFQLSLEWKFECPTCRRYIVCSIKVTL